MAAADLFLSADALRAFAATRVASDGLGQVARAIGVPKSGLKYFLEGATPRRPTLRKFQDWYLRVTLEGIPSSEASAEAAALAFLLRDLPEPLRPEAYRRALALWGELFDVARLPQPLWLRHLRNTP